MNLTDPKYICKEKEKEKETEQERLQFCLKIGVSGVTKLNQMSGSMNIDIDESDSDSQSVTPVYQRSYD